MVTDEELENLDKQLDEELKKIAGSGGAPDTQSKDSIMKFFREVINTKDSRKIANLSERELGIPNLSVRRCLDIANYAEEEGLDDVSEYLKRQAENTLATSMSRKGFLAKLFVTQIKKEQKIDEKPVKKGLFSGGSNEQNEHGE